MSAAGTTSQAMTRSDVLNVAWLGSWVTARSKSQATTVDANDLGLELGKTGAFVGVDPNTMRDYTYMADHMGNIVGVIDCENETGHRQVFDAFGNVIGDYALLRCAADHDWTDEPCHLARIAGLAPPVCPRPPAQPIARMQTGGFNWRGNEGSVTDRVTEDMPDTETHELRWSAYERPSTGFVYMQARYYEPATGRFLTADPVPYGFETVLTGQNNRWTYCANDPVNFSDPSGRLLFTTLIVILILVLLFALINGLLSQANGGCFWAGAAGGSLIGLGVGVSIFVPGGLGLAALIGGSAFGSGLSSLLNGNAMDAVLFDFFVGGMFAWLFGAAGDELLSFLIGLDASLISSILHGIREAL